MLFVSAEQRLASASFDTFVQYTDGVLRDPAVAARLGGIASDLRSVNSSAFLPNIRGGTFVVPRRQRGTDNLAIVPLTDEQADNAYAVTAPLSAEPPVREWSAQEAASSTRYGLELAEELEAVFQDGPQGEANAPSLKGLRPGTMATTRATFGSEADGLYWATRPVLMIRNRLLHSGAVACGATVAHEEVHALDILEDGPLYGTLTYGGATELRAYHVGATIYRVYDVDTLEAQESILLDLLRKQEVGNTSWPFTPNALLMNAMIRTGKI
ncbi:MAG TPA: hypothetical protein VLH84_02005 [Patescibacteria group bacterium]|nr:hypothetical protein [Patescibacteria group bacterium]